ncbi:MAG: ATP-grasp domain-containing protein [Proteobacteria bacterium]|nr:MAG: ATP-grasp domain-containing protein [Pseudomonadota bacterium]
MENKTVAIFYQAKAPPAVNGIKKPQKPGGYSDGGADIGFALKKAGINVLTPVANPDPTQVKDWVYPDTDMGLRQAFLDGAQIFWMNTVLHEDHPIQRIRSNDLWIVGQDAEAVQLYDDKFVANRTLRDEGYAVAASAIIDGTDVKIPASTQYPVILKPIRGRGSVGVTLINSEEELRGLIEQWMMSDEFGHSFMLEEYLPGEEITITVMPAGTYVIEGKEEVKTKSWALPAVKRFDQVNGVAPYNGTVAVIHNSKVMTAEELSDLGLIGISEACEKVSDFVKSKAAMRIDCRKGQNGNYKIFDVNMKPNLTGSGRPGREEFDSLCTMSAAAIGWSYSDFVVNVLRNAWASR